MLRRKATPQKEKKKKPPPKSKKKTMEQERERERERYRPSISAVPSRKGLRKGQTREATEYREREENDEKRGEEERLMKGGCRWQAVRQWGTRPIDLSHLLSDASRWKNHISFLPSFFFFFFSFLFFFVVVVSPGFPSADGFGSARESRVTRLICISSPAPPHPRAP